MGTARGVRARIVPSEWRACGGLGGCSGGSSGATPRSMASSLASCEGACDETEMHACMGARTTQAAAALLESPQL
eukprot:1694941-Pleurochrysis_carterae.AAC.1